MGCCTAVLTVQDVHPREAPDIFTCVGPTEPSPAQPSSQSRTRPQEESVDERSAAVATEANEHCDEMLTQILDTAMRLQARAEQCQETLVAQAASPAVQCNEGSCRNGIALATYDGNGQASTSGDEGGADSTTLGRMEQGDDLEIFRRNVGGWAYCRSCSSGAAGWVPADYVAELAAVLADHEAEGLGAVMNAKAGDLVEVAIRHYSGWSFCREWLGMEHLAESRREGWVSDAYLEDRISELCQVTRFQRTIGEALARVSQGAQQFRGLAASVRGGPASSESLTGDWLEHCLECVTLLAEELASVEGAASAHQASRIVPGARVQAAHALEPVGPHGLQLAAGDALLVLHVEGLDWAWCTAEGTGCDGWVPCSGLARGAQEDAPAASPPAPPASSALLAPLCAICLEPLGLGQGREALPCAHAFHRSCLGPWLLEKSECPLCRAPCGPHVPLVVRAPQQQSARPRSSSRSRTRSRPSRGILMRRHGR